MEAESRVQQFTCALLGALSLPLQPSGRSKRGGLRRNGPAHSLGRGQHRPQEGETNTILAINGYARQSLRTIAPDRVLGWSSSPLSSHVNSSHNVLPRRASLLIPHFVFFFRSPASSFVKGPCLEIFLWVKAMWWWTEPPHLTATFCPYLYRLLHCFGHSLLLQSIACIISMILTALCPQLFSSDIHHFWALLLFLQIFYSDSFISGRFWMSAFLLF